MHCRVYKDCGLNNNAKHRIVDFLIAKKIDALQKKIAFLFDGIGSPGKSSQKGCRKHGEKQKFESFEKLCFAICLLGQYRDRTNS